MPFYTGIPALFLFPSAPFERKPLFTYGALMGEATPEMHD